MSKYTTELRYICESLTGHNDSVGYDDIDSVIDDAVPLIFTFDFPIFDETYRTPLCTKILRHYYTREIGLETYGLWKLKLQTKLNEIMPYYNKLYETELFKYNPLYDVDMTTTNVGSKTGENTNVGTNRNTTEKDSKNVINEVETNNDKRINTSSSSETTENNDVKRDLYSDTPQGALTGVESGTYLTNARKISDDVSGNRIGNNVESTQGDNSRVNSSEHTSTGGEVVSGESSTVGRTRNTEDYVMHVMGKSAGASYAKMIKDFRENLLNIDMDVIRDLSDLFMLIW